MKNAHLEALKPQDKIEVAARYVAGESTYDLARAFRTTSPTISKALRQMGVPRRDSSTSRRTHSINEKSFDVVTDESAYWIGFIMADGSVSGNRIDVRQTESDKQHLEKLRAFLGSDHPIRTGKRLPLIHPRTGKRYLCKSVCHLGIWCKPLAESLRQYGIHSRKSYGTKVVGLENNPHFWRGVIDGDGSYLFTRNGITKHYPVIQLVGSKELLQQFLDFAKSLLPAISSTVHISKIGLAQANVNGPFACQLASVLHPPGCVALPRKSLVAQEFIAWPSWRKSLFGR